MIKHTQGPWANEGATRHERKTIPLRAIDCERLGFCLTFVNGERKGEAEANARLIAAAPDLLEALESAMKEDESAEFELWLDRVRPSGDAERVQLEWEQSSPFLDHSDKWAAAIAAIAKAKGDAK